MHAVFVESVWLLQAMSFAITLITTFLTLIKRVVRRVMVHSPLWTTANVQHYMSREDRVAMTDVVAVDQTPETGALKIMRCNLWEAAETNCCWNSQAWRRWNSHFSFTRRAFGQDTNNLWENVLSFIMINITSPFWIQYLGQLNIIILRRVLALSIQRMKVLISDDHDSLQSACRKNQNRCQRQSDS